MKKIIRQSLNILLLIFLLVLPYFVFAENVTNATLEKLKAVGETNGGYAAANEQSAAGITGTVIRAFLSLLGVIFLTLMLYGGYNWMIAHGDESKVDKAKDTIRTAIIGLIIILGSYAIWAFLLKRIIEGL